MNKFQDRMIKATDLFNAGFTSEASRKRAMEALNRAYDALHEEVFNRVLSKVEVLRERNVSEEEVTAVFRANDIPFQLNHVRQNHMTIIGVWVREGLEIIETMLDLRNSIKSAELLPIVKNTEEKEKIEAVRKTILEEMVLRKTQYIETLDIARLFRGLPVSVKAFWVYNPKGEDFIRHYFYVRGKLTPLNVIIAAADTYKRETKEVA